MTTDKIEFSPRASHYQSYEDAANQNPILKVQIELTGKYVYIFKDEFYYRDDKDSISIRYFAFKAYDRFAIL